jgi:hypothetical protein
MFFDVVHDNKVLRALYNIPRIKALNGKNAHKLVSALEVAIPKLTLSLT